MTEFFCDTCDDEETIPVIGYNFSEDAVLEESESRIPCPNCPRCIGCRKTLQEADIMGKGPALHTEGEPDDQQHGCSVECVCAWAERRVRIDTALVFETLISFLAQWRADHGHSAEALEVTASLLENIETAVRVLLNEAHQLIADGE